MAVVSVVGKHVVVVKVNTAKNRGYSLQPGILAHFSVCQLRKMIVLKSMTECAL